MYPSWRPSAPSVLRIHVTQTASRLSPSLLYFVSCCLSKIWNVPGIQQVLHIYRKNESGHLLSPQLHAVLAGTGETHTDRQTYIPMPTPRPAGRQRQAPDLPSNLSLPDSATRPFTFNCTLSTRGFSAGWGREGCMLRGNSQHSSASALIQLYFPTRLSSCVRGTNPPSY